MLTLCVAALISSAAIWDDITRRRISNWISLTALCGGLSIQCFESGWRGCAGALLGMLTGGAVFLIFYLLGGMGAGDIKLMAGFGALLGVGGILEASLWTAACGGLMAAGVLLARFVRARVAPSRLSEPRSGSIPYAPAIAAGVLLSLASRGSQ